jgi:hypothetical protein
MKKYSKLLIVVLSVIFISSCSRVHGEFLSEHENAWIDGYKKIKGYNGTGLVYCRANKKDEGLADPVCFKARFEDYEDEKRDLEKRKRRSRR